MATAPERWFYVTGCDSGFGELAVELISSKGYGVFAGVLLPASRDRMVARYGGRAAVPTHWKTSGVEAAVRIIPIVVDVTSDRSVRAAAEHVGGELARRPAARLAGLVNNAGYLASAGPLEWTPAGDFESMLAVNVVGMSRVTNSVLPLLRRSQGRIVNLSSAAGMLSLPTQGAYSCTKFAVEGYSDALRREMLPWGVTVHIIEPGVFASTDLYKRYYDGVQRLWDAAPAQVRGDYGSEWKDEVAEILAAAPKTYTNTDPSIVPRAVLHALTGRRPKYRYRAGVDAKWGFSWMALLHERWQDAILLAKATKNRPAAAAADGAAVALRRYPVWVNARAAALCAAAALLRRRGARGTAWVALALAAACFLFEHRHATF